MAKVPLSLAIGEYDHVRDLLDGTVPVAGVELTVLRLPVEEMFYRFLLHERVRRLRSVVRQDRRAGGAGRPTVRSAAGVSVARVPPLVDLRSQRRRHRAARGPRGQARRRARMGADRGDLFARAARARIRRRSRLDPLASGGRERAGTARKGRARAAFRLPPHRRRGPLALRHAAGRRSRCRALRATAGAVRARRPARAAALRRLSRRRARLRAQDRHLSDHARGRDAARDLRARPLARDEPVQGVRRSHGGAASRGRRT